MLNKDYYRAIFLKEFVAMFIFKDRMLTIVFLPLIIILFFIVPISLLALTDEMELFSEAESRYYGENYSIALEMYDEFLKKYPLSDLIPDVQYRRAVCLYRLGKLESAMSLFQSIEKRYRATKFFKYVPFWKGVILFHQAKYSPAKENLTIFLQTAKDIDLKLQALLYKGISEVYLFMFPDARRTMNELMDIKGGVTGLSPYESVLYSYILLKEGEYRGIIDFQDSIDYGSFPDLWQERLLLYRGEALWQMGDIDRAEALYRGLLDAYPAAAAISFRRLYIIAQQRQDFSEMERIILQAEEKFALSPEILIDLWLRIGIESFRRDEYDLAQYFFNKIWNLRSSREVPEAVPAYLAEIYIIKEDAESAEGIIEEYIDRTGNQPAWLLFRLGNIYLINGNFNGASRVFTRVIQLYPDSIQEVRARYFLAYSLYRESRYENALDNCLLLSEEELGEGFNQGFYRLKALILKKLGRIDESITVLQEYVEIYPNDTRAQLDLIRLFFATRRYQDLVSHSDLILSVNSDLEEKDLHSFLLIKYLQGLSHIALKSFESAQESFHTVTREKLDRAGLSGIFPYVEYYRGWTLYRINEFGNAAERFTDFLQAFPSHELYPQALFMSAWCYYSLGNFEKSNRYFSQLAKRDDSSLRDKAAFLQGKSLENLKRNEESGRVFKELFTEYPQSPFADDSLFEYAGILDEEGDIDEAAERYLELFNTYRFSALAEESLYKRGEIYFNNGQYREAKSSFNLYRISYPEGKLIDAALYWEGLSAYRIGEKSEAPEIWKNIIISQRNSPFRPDAFMKSSDVYVELGQYPVALRLIETLMQQYPDYSRVVDAELRAEEIRYLIYGFSRREAELTAVISKQGGVKTREGREAMLELSRLYILEKGQKLERAFQMLSQVNEVDDPVTGAEAQFLLGEYYERLGEYEKAGREFFRASLKNPDEQEFMAYSIFRAAFSMKQAGKSREASELVKRLEEGFPESEWTLKGKKLMEE